MKTFSVKMLALFICVATVMMALVLATSCQKKEVIENKKLIVENGLSEYVIIRPDKVSPELLNKMLDLHRTIMDKIGYQFKINTDWVRKPEDIDPSAFEILIGNTNRPESKEVVDALGPNSWAIVEKGNKIVICTTNDALLTVAIDWFVENCINVEDKTVAVPEDLRMIKDYGDRAVLSVSGLSGYQAVYPEGNLMLEHCGTLFKRRADIDSVVSDKSNEIACEIVLGNTNRTDPVTFKGDNEYSITVDGTKVYINGSNDNAIYYAVNEFLENGISYKDTIISVLPDSSKQGTLKNYFSDGWSIALPYVEEGDIAPVYNIGPGLDSDLLMESPGDSYVYLVSNVEFSAFENYAKKLESFGFKKVYSAKTDKNDLWGFRFGEAYAYVHYSPMQKSMRIIWDKSSNCEVSEFEYVEKQTGRTSFYQYSIDYTGASWNTDDVGANCGMLYFIKLQDNSLIMVDGGLTSQVSGETMRNLYSYLYQITGTDKKEPLKIRLWYFTHPDGDHNQGAVSFLQYANSSGVKPIVERVAFNYPSERANEKVKKDTASYTMIEYMNKNYPNIKYLKLHTGMVFNIGEVKVETIGTVENIFDTSGKIPDNWDTNDTCVLLRFYLGDKSVMMQGDVGNDRKVQNYHIALYSPEFFKSDILQVSHHGYNDLVTLNEYCDPEYALISNAEKNVGRRSYYKGLVGEGKLYFAGEYTTVLTVTRGRISVKTVPR